MNVKELVESVKVHECTLSFSLPKIQVVEKSEFDRVIKELTKPKVFDIDCAGKAMIRVVVDGDGISVTNAMNGGGDVIPTNKIVITTNT